MRELTYDTVSEYLQEVITGLTPLNGNRVIQQLLDDAVVIENAVEYDLCGERAVEGGQTHERGEAPHNVGVAGACDVRNAAGDGPGAPGEPGCAGQFLHPKSGGRALDLGRQRQRQRQRQKEQF